MLLRADLGLPLTWAIFVVDRYPLHRARHHTLVQWFTTPPR